MFATENTQNPQAHMESTYIMETHITVGMEDILVELEHFKSKNTSNSFSQQINVERC